MYVQQPYLKVNPKWRPPRFSELPKWPVQGRMGLDTETCDPLLTKLGPGVRRGAYLVGVSYSMDDKTGRYLPIAHAGGGNLDREHTLQWLRDQVQGFRGEIVGANLQYDLDFLAEVGITFHPSVKFRDVQLADPLCYELHMNYSLDEIARRRGVPKKDERLLLESGKIWGLGRDIKTIKKNLWKLPSYCVGDYAEYDAVLPLKLLELQEEELRAQSLWDVWELETDVLPVALAMRRRGVRIDKRKLQEISDWTEQVEREEMAKIRAATGIEVRLGDTQKNALLSRALKRIGLDCPLTPKTKKPSIDAAFLREHPHLVTDALLRARQFAKLRTTFCKQVWDQLVGDRVHCTFNQLRTEKKGSDESKGAAFGRFSSTDFNIQNQPIRHKEYGKLWRSIYVPDHGKVWSCSDFSSQEPRLAVHFGAIMGFDGATVLAQKYCTDLTIDPHSATAAMMFPDQWRSLKKYYEAGPATSQCQNTSTHMKQYTEAERLRSIAKTLFLGLCYGMGGGKLCLSLGLPTVEKSFINSKGKVVTYLSAGPEGSSVLEKFHQRVPFIGMLAREAKKRAESRGYVKTWSGRRCRFRRKDSEYIETHKALNRIIQGSAGDQMKIALRELHRRGIPIQLTVHDEVDWSASSEDEMREVGRIMMNAVKLRVPSKVDIEYGDSWGYLTGKVAL